LRRVEGDGVRRVDLAHARRAVLLGAELAAPAVHRHDLRRMTGGEDVEHRAPRSRPLRRGVEIPVVDDPPHPVVVTPALDVGEELLGRVEERADLLGPVNDGAVDAH
jgi:hypothetical protein